jgi:ribosomal protein S18 acetylase RimI-like enzyme
MGEQVIDDSHGHTVGTRTWHDAGMAVERATATDIASWLEIVREVEPLFGPMPAFDGTLERGIARDRAWCVRGTDGAVLGGMLLSPPERATIDWLAVRAGARGNGHGRALVAHALQHFANAPEVLVDTFGEDNPDGRAARRLYESFGFVAAEDLERGPEGGTRQRFRWRRATAPRRTR